MDIASIIFLFGSLIYCELTIVANLIIYFIKM